MKDIYDPKRIIDGAIDGASIARDNANAIFDIANRYIALNSSGVDANLQNRAIKRNRKRVENMYEAVVSGATDEGIYARRWDRARAIYSSKFRKP